MKKIRNAWLYHPDYNCFGCCPDNEHGLKMEFCEDGEEIVSEWLPTRDSQGWIGVLHGGIQATLADEIASWVVFRKLQTMGVTAKMEVRYRKPVRISDGAVTLRARLAGLRRNFADIDVKIFDASGTLCTDVHCVYFVSSREEAEKQGFRSFEVE